jgi:hypothetical protein
MNGNCPSCKQPVTQLTCSSLPVRGGGREWKGATFNCPLCSAVLGAGIDPIGLKADIVAELLEELQKARR